MVKVLLLSSLMLWTAFSAQQENDLHLRLPQTLRDKNTISNQDILIGEISYPQGEYYPMDDITTEIILRNYDSNEKERIVELNVFDRNGYQVGHTTNTATLPEHASVEHQITWSIPTIIISGRYYLEVIIWEKNLETKASKVLLKDRDKTGFLVYRQIDEFERINDQMWGISSKKLGRGQFQRKNVATENGCLAITLPGNTLNGGEIYTKVLQTFGVYEVKMKLPDAPSSITGFFFYLVPDYYNEIDIEVFNNTKGELYLTTYGNGKVSRQYAGALGFDPTKGFHNYGIEFQEDCLAFSIDNIVIKEWKKDYPKEPMHLYMNSWYPTWLEGTKPSVDQKLLIDWFKY